MKQSKFKKLLLLLAVCMITSLLCIPLVRIETEAAAQDITLTNTTITNKQTLTLNGGTYLIPEGKRIIIEAGGSLTITGHGVIKEYNADANNANAMITVKPGGTLTIIGDGVGSNSIIFDGNAGDTPPVTTQHPFLRCAGTVTLDHVTMKNINNQNTANQYGGGAIASSIVTNNDDKDLILTMNYCLIRNCKSRFGSVMYIKGNSGSVSIQNSLFYDNEVASDTSSATKGGTIFTEESTNLPISLTHCIFRNNTTVASSGAGIYWAGLQANSSLTITDCQFLNNTARTSAGSGGAIYSFGKNVTIVGTGTTVTDAKTDAKTPTESITGTLFQGNDISNISSTYGGAICIASTQNTTETATISITGNVLFNNNAARHGGALAVKIDNATTSSIKLQIDGATFDSNAAKGTTDGVTRGGAIYIYKGSGTDKSAAPTGDLSDESYLKNITIQNGNALEGGGLYLENLSLSIVEAFTVTNCTVNTTSGGGGGNGGGLCVRNGTLSFAENCTVTITNNKTAIHGGGLYANNSTIDLDSVTSLIFSGNTCSNSGGGICITASSTLNLSNGAFSNNEAANGGGIYVANGCTLNVKENSTLDIVDNETSSNGGGLNVNGGILTVPNGCTLTISGNQASGDGGGFYAANSATLTFTGCALEVSGNTATRDGGGLYVGGASTFTLNEISSFVISDNESSHVGGGICITNNITLTLKKATITNNNAANGGGVYVGNHTTLIFPTNSTVLVSQNTATSNGGGIHLNEGSTFWMETGMLEKNAASSSGGGVYVHSSTFVLAGGAIQGKGEEINVASRGGGVCVYDTNASFTMTGGTIENCRSSDGGGGIYVSTNAKFFMNGGTIQKCVAYNNGAGVYVLGIEDALVATTLFQMTDGLIAYNKTERGNGGAVYINTGATFQLEGGTLSNNVAIKSGGGVSIRDGYFYMTGGTITQNRVNGSKSANSEEINKTYCGGGGIGVYGDRIGKTMNVYIHGGTISNNHSAINGGGIAAKITDKTTDDEEVHDVAINIYVGCSACCGKHNGETLTCANIGEASHTCPVITGNTSMQDGGGFYLHSTYAANSSASLYLYCGTATENTATNLNSRNAYQTGGNISQYGFSFGESTNPAITLIGGNFIKYEDEGEAWTAIAPVTVRYWLSWESGLEVYKETQISVGVVLNTPPYTNSNGDVTVSWHIGAPESTEFTYVGDVYTVPDTDVVNLYAVYKAQGHGTEQSVTLQTGADYSFAPDKETVSIAANATLTVQFTITGMHPQYYKERVLSFENQTEESVLPKAGTTIIMVVQLYKETSTVREYYYYTFDDDYSGPIALTQFQKMGTGTAYAYPTGITTGSFDDYTESYTLIVDFNNTISSDAVGNITLSRYADEAFNTGGASNAGDVANQTAVFTLCANRRFEVSDSVTAGTKVDDPFTVTYTTQASNGSDNTCEGKFVSLVLSGPFAKDTVLTVGANKYYLTSQGQFIVPLENIDTSNTLQFSSKNAHAITVTAEIWVSDAECKPFAGVMVTSKEFTLQAKTLPALKISMTQQVFDLNALPANQTISVTDHATSQGYTVVWSVQKKDGNGNYEATNLVSVVDGKLVWNSPTAGTYRIVATVKNGDDVVMTVPCSFILLE